MHRFVGHRFRVGLSLVTHYFVFLSGGGVPRFGVGTGASAKFFLPLSSGCFGCVGIFVGRLSPGLVSFSPTAFPLIARCRRFAAFSFPFSGRLFSCTGAYLFDVPASIFSLVRSLTTFEVVSGTAMYHAPVLDEVILVGVPRVSLSPFLKLMHRFFGHGGGAFSPLPTLRGHRPFTASRLSSPTL